MVLIKYQKIFIQYIINNIYYIIMNSKNIIFQDLIKNQRKILLPERKLSLSDLKRISSYLTTSIFTENCSIWCGYVTEIKNNCHFVNFFFNGKKQALHRILYYNFVDDICDNEYLKFSCDNKGKCCCINHIMKVVNTTDKPKPHYETVEIDVVPKNKKKITVEF